MCSNSTTEQHCHVFHAEIPDDWKTVVFYDHLEEGGARGRLLQQMSIPYDIAMKLFEELVQIHADVIEATTAQTWDTHR